MATGRETLEVPLMACISVAEADHCALREERVFGTRLAFLSGVLMLAALSRQKIIPEACFQKG
jgi:hypothetical protein